jgi:hypothetical protein
MHRTPRAPLATDHCACTHAATQAEQHDASLGGCQAPPAGPPAEEVAQDFQHSKNLYRHLHSGGGGAGAGGTRGAHELEAADLT